MNVKTAILVGSIAFSLGALAGLTRDVYLACKSIEADKELFENAKKSAQAN